MDARMGCKSRRSPLPPERNVFRYLVAFLLLNCSPCWGPFCTVLVFFFEKKLPIVVVCDICPSVRLSVRLSSVEIISFYAICNFLQTNLCARL